MLLIVGSDVSLDKLVRALFGIIMFRRLYCRGDSWWAVSNTKRSVRSSRYSRIDVLKSMGLIILPQALKITIPSLRIRLLPYLKTPARAYHWLV